MADEKGTGRFPVPEEWILDRLPKEFHGLFGFRGDRHIEPEETRDEVQYTYTADIPGGTMKKSLLVEYFSDDAPAVAFIIGDTIDLDGVPVTVQDWQTRKVPPLGGDRGYGLHLVEVRLAESRD